MNGLYEFDGNCQNLYNSGGGGNQTATTLHSADPAAAIRSNPFALQQTTSLTGISANNQSTNNSLFGNSTGGNVTAFGTQNNNSIFGGNGTIKPSGFGNMAGNIFGGGSGSGVGNSSSNASIFGSAQTTNFNGLFGTTSSFGGSNASSGGGPFSSGQPTSDKSLFSLAQLSGQQSTAPAGNPFAITSGIGAQTGNPIFGGPATFAMKPTGLFSSVDATSTTLDGPSSVPGHSTGIFASFYNGLMQQPQQQQQTNLFVQNPMSTNVFGAPQSSNQSIFGTTSLTTIAPAVISTASELFCQANAAFGNTAPSNGFFGATNPQISSVFGAQQPNAFSAPQPLIPASNSQPDTRNIFAGFSSDSNGTVSQSTGIFANFQQQTSQPLELSSFGGNTAPAFSTLSQQSADNIYSQMSDLTIEEIEQFKANTFEIGKIPTKPPPKELCV